jgi:type I restriction enzyme S subunit
MAKYKAYPEYKDSGVEWLGDIPTHWQLIPCRAAVSHIVDKNHDGKINNYLSLMANVGVIRYEEKGDIGNKKPDDLTKCKIVKKGQLVINSMNYGIGSYGMSPFDGICSPVYIILEPRENTLKRYALRIFENTPFQKHLATFGNGILEHRAAIKWDDIKGQIIPLPSKDEQSKILKLLDLETAKIDNLIEKQQQLIELLKEKRQAVISHAVTKGLNPDVPMKDSGVEWLGEVPEHWDILPLQRLLKKIEQGSSPVAQNRVPENGEYGVLKISSIKNGVFISDEVKTLDSILQYENRFKVKHGDLLVTRANTPNLVADACVVNIELPHPVMISDLIYRLDATTMVNKDFLCSWLISSFGRLQIKMDARGSSMSMAKVSQEHIKSWLTVLPPLKEQLEINLFLNIEKEKLLVLISKAELAINLLQERRTALISAAVTGKIDVRDWASPDAQDVEETREATA